MLCPNCNKELIISPIVERHLARYDQPVTARTGCCKTLVRCVPKTSYTAVPYLGNLTQDDWGN